MANNSLPPVEKFMPTSTGWSYREMLKAGRGRTIESAVYGSSGEFEFKVLRLTTAHVYYQSRTRDLSEIPFAISLIGSSAK